MPSPAIKLLVGLGNPGEKYAQTRHNAGFWLVERVSRLAGAVLKSESRFHGKMATVAIPGAGTVRLLTPTTFMNASGRSVGAVARYFDLTPEEIVVAHDEIDLPPGTARLKKGGGHGGHNGLRDIIPQLASADFYRLRIGVGHPGTKEQVIGYVLDRASKAEQNEIDDSLDRIVARIDELMNGEIERFMNDLHRKSAS